MKDWTGERLETFVFNEAMIEHLHRYAVALNFIENKTVLDIACGEGYGSNLLAEKALSVTSVDIDESTINNALKKYRKANLNFIKGDVISIPVADKIIDVAISFETIEHISDHEKMILEIKRVLKDDGVFIISTPDKKYYSDEGGYANPHHQKELYENEFKELLQKHFAAVKFYRQSFVHGSLINGTGSLNLFSGDYENILHHVPHPSYWVAIASGKELNDLPSSFFFNEDVYKKIVEYQIREVKKTASYRLGHFLLSPFKFIRRIVKS